MYNSSKDTTLVVGLGSSGLATMDWLKDNNRSYIGWDDNEELRQKLASQNYVIATRIGLIDWECISSLILSPGVPYHHPKSNEAVIVAEQHNIPVMGDISLLFEVLSSRRKNIKFIGITGTNGKSTTTDLVSEVLKNAKKNYMMAGNIGVPVMKLVDRFDGDIVLLELSSYQLDLNIQDHFDSAALINITPDHLDRHGGLEGYIAAKKNIFNNQSSQNLAIVCIDDRYCSEIANQLTHSNLVRVSGTNNSTADYYIENHSLIKKLLNGTKLSLFNFESSLYLHGNHNYQNAAVAYLLCKQLNIEDQIIFDSFLNYKGLPHRQEFVLKHKNMTFINDSKATNADATAPALGTFKNIIWILGGVEKSGGIESLTERFDSLQYAVCYGKSAAQFNQTIRNKSIISSAVVNSLEESIDLAIEYCENHKDTDFTILLSPAAASFDQFKNFEHRGNVYKDYIVKKITAGS